MAEFGSGAPRRLAVVATAAVAALWLAGCAQPPLSQMTPGGGTASSIVDALSGWVGDYDFEEDLGTSDEGSAGAGLDYHITIAQLSDAYQATISINGQQTMQNLLASVQGDANTVTLVFVSYNGDNLFQPYAPGVVLLTLARQGDALVTTWGAITPQLASNQPPGNYFVGNVG